MHLLKGHHSALIQKQFLWCELPCPPGLPGPHIQSLTHPPPGPGDMRFLSLAGRFQTVWPGFIPEREENSSLQWTMGEKTPKCGFGAWVSEITCSQASSLVAVGVQVQDKHNPAGKSDSGITQGTYCVTGPSETISISNKDPETQGLNWAVSKVMSGQNWDLGVTSKWFVGQQGLVFPFRHDLS